MYNTSYIPVQYQDKSWEGPLLSRLPSPYMGLWPDKVSISAQFNSRKYWEFNSSELVKVGMRLLGAHPSLGLSVADSSL